MNTEKPIIFSTNMVKAILEGRKTVTRRVITPQPQAPKIKSHGGLNGISGERTFFTDGQRYFTCPYGEVGNRLWVRETWCEADELFDGVKRVPAVTIGYRADLSARFNQTPIDTTAWNWKHESVKWRPSIFMPRWAARIFLEVTGIKAERLQDICEEDIKLEGMRNNYEIEEILGTIKGSLPLVTTKRISDNAETFGFREKFATIWNGINGKRRYTWENNPWVWVIGFKRVEAE